MVVEMKSLPQNSMEARERGGRWGLGRVLEREREFRVSELCYKAQRVPKLHQSKQGTQLSNSASFLQPPLSVGSVTHLSLRSQTHLEKRKRKRKRFGLVGSALMVVVAAMGLCFCFGGRGSTQWRRRWRASGFDIEAVLDGDVEAEDGGGGDGEVVREGAWRL